MAQSLLAANSLAQRVGRDLMSRTLGVELAIGA
jgi:hypothetical protein